ncbi:MAG: hypothetical protein C6Y22_17460 [Hapalosiphonaceae cyanobacterium JJU2]|nr:MAG: hypothetical protein C6Y22_17460 [Hapalosiphonaceae cyanobacterium JJU2]
MRHFLKKMRIQKKKNNKNRYPAKTCRLSAQTNRITARTCRLSAKTCRISTLSSRLFPAKT